MPLLSFWLFDFSFNDNGDVEIFEFELALEFAVVISSELFWCSLDELALLAGVFDEGRESEFSRSRTGLRISWSIGGRVELGDELTSSFFVDDGDLGRVSAKAWVCKFKSFIWTYEYWE